MRNHNMNLDTLRLSIRAQLVRLKARPKPYLVIREGVLLACFDGGDVAIDGSTLERLRALPDGAGIDAAHGAMEMEERSEA